MIKQEISNLLGFTIYLLTDDLFGLERNVLQSIAAIILMRKQTLRIRIIKREGLLPILAELTLSQVSGN